MIVSVQILFSCFMVLCNHGDRYQYFEQRMVSTLSSAWYNNPKDCNLEINVYFLSIYADSTVSWCIAG
jgi:hypothetical protein